jgi:hypothetical protein
MRKVVTAAILAAVVAFPAQAGAIVGGTDDTGNLFESVGDLQLQSDGEWFDFCSGTLVAEDIVLTSAHCVDFFTAEVGDPDGLGTDDLRVTFDPTPDDASTYYGVDEIVIHPDWLAREQPPVASNSKHQYLEPGNEDVALIFLAEPVTSVTPSPVADADYWVGFDIGSQDFTVVGYGTDAYITGSAAANHPIVEYDGDRSYRDVSAIPAHDAFPDRYIKVGAGVCFGDSGGPLFHEGTVVGLNAWTFSYRCSGPNLEYRLDSPEAQAFLDQYL